MSNKPMEYNEIPVFEYDPPGIREIFQDTLFDITILVLWSVFLIAGSFIAFVKYDVR